MSELILKDIFLHARMTPRVEGVVKPGHPARGMPAAVGGRTAASGQAVAVVFVAEAALHLDAAIKPSDGDGGHGHAIEPVLLDHGVAGRVLQRDAVAGAQRMGEGELPEDVAGQAGVAGQLAAPGAFIGQHAGRK